MKLTASLIVHNELERYLAPCIDSLLTFCDEVRVVDDWSTDGSYDWLIGMDRVYVATTIAGRFYDHEGQARNHLLDWTLLGEPTHILNIDADEFIADGRVLRGALELDPINPVWTIRMQEIWEADDVTLGIRSDGGWRQHDAPILWKVPAKMTAEFRVSDKKLSSGREPMAVRAQWHTSRPTGTEILHFGWTNEAERQTRYERYVEHDGGKFHTSRHLRSIMYERRRVRVTPRDWPRGLESQKDAILRYARGEE